MSGLAADLAKLLIAAILGFVAKLLYDRRFSRRADVRFSFEQPATFGAGDKARVYQNLEIINVGGESATDVRIIFRRPGFDLVEHQLQFAGQSITERDDERSVIVIPSLPPTDRALISFVFSPEKVQIKNIQDLLVSVRASNSLGRPGVARDRNIGETIFASVVLTIVTALAMGFILQNLLGVTLPGLGPRRAAREGEEIIRLVMQTPDAVVRGKAATIEIFVENLSTDPFVGWVEARPPRWPGDQADRLIEEITVAPGKRHVLRWNLSVPKQVLPGRYEFSGEVSGWAFNRRGKVYTNGVIQVK